MIIENDLQLRSSLTLTHLYILLAQSIDVYTLLRMHNINYETKLKKSQIDNANFSFVCTYVCKICTLTLILILSSNFMYVIFSY